MFEALCSSLSFTIKSFIWENIVVTSLRYEGIKNHYNFSAWLSAITSVYAVGGTF